MEEIVHGGWLKKSPPEKWLRRAKWRRRWFVLRHSGQIPGQYVLEYFTDDKCKKLKGRIDLDQCEQVNAGVSPDAVPRKFAFENIFDIRTPKRIYYLVADREADMNKWVACICSVCGLKLFIEDEMDALAVDAGSGLMAMERIPPSPTLSATVTEDSQLLASPSSLGSSGPYIPISECISGTTPITNGFQGTRFMNDLDDEEDNSFLDNVPPPPPPKGIERCKKLSAEFYDFPRCLHPSSMDDPPTQRSVERESLDPLAVSPLPPKVNWETYPRSESEAIYKNRRSSGDYDHPSAQRAFTSGPCADDTADLKRLSLTDSGIDTQRSAASSPQDNADSAAKQESSLNSSLPSVTARTPSLKPPPRPPKPKPLCLVETLQLKNSTQPANRNDYHNVYDNTSSLYDVPPSLQATFIGSRDMEDVLDVAVPLNSSSSSRAAGPSVDEMYDFPRSIHDDRLNATPPAPKGEGLWQQGRHAYSNAPTFVVVDGCGADNGGEEYLMMDHHPRRHSDIYTDMSGENQSQLPLYSNLPSPRRKNEVFVLDAPPAVNRELKQRRCVEPNSSQSVKSPVVMERKLSDSSTHSATTNLLGPPPVIDRGLKPKRLPDSAEHKGINHSEIHGHLDGQPCSSGSLTVPKGNPSQPSSPSTSAGIHPVRNHRSFRKPRAIPSPSPRHGHSRSAPMHPSSRMVDRSSSDEDQSSGSNSRRNSSNDDSVASKKTAQGKSPSPSAGELGCRHEPEVQYLDLDLESDASAQSPKSPEKFTSNTVYKTVDFLKTNAFNKMRQNLEETYRKSQ